MYAQLDKLEKLNPETKLATMKALFGNDNEVLKALSIMTTKGIEGYRETVAKLENQATLRERVEASLNTLGINGKPLAARLLTPWRVSVKPSRRY
jgi:hypothetical protein